MVVLLFACGHWSKGLAQLLGTRQICKKCVDVGEGRHTDVIGTASVHQIFYDELGPLAPVNAS